MNIVNNRHNYYEDDCQDYQHDNKYMCDSSRNNCPSYAEFKSYKEFEKSDPCDCIKSLLCYEAWKCKCDTKLYCEATSRLTYELCMARNLCQVKEVMDSICCLFSAGALKENALANLIKAYGIACNKKKFDCCDCCDCCCKEMMKD